MNSQAPQLPQYALLTDLAFAVCGLLIDGADSEKRLVERLRAMGWDPLSGKSAEYRIIRNFEQQGLINLGELYGQTFCTLTTRGYDLWVATLDFRKKSSEYWEQHRPSKRPLHLTEPAKREIETVVERAPTDEEHEILMSRARADFKLVYRFSRHTGARPMDLLNAQVESIDFENNTLTLEPKSVTGREIDTPVIALDPEAVSMLKDAIGKRKRGPVFLHFKGSAWTYGNFSGSSGGCELS